MEYSIIRRFDGYYEFRVEANSKEEAEAIAEDAYLGVPERCVCYDDAEHSVYDFQILNDYTEDIMSAEEEDKEWEEERQIAEKYYANTSQVK